MLVIVVVQQQTEPLEFPAAKVTKENILKNEQFVDAKERKFPGASLAYITPWNNRGYDLAKWAANKFTHISPVWLQFKPQTADMAASCRIEGTHDIDRGWMTDIRKNNSEIKFVPRILFDQWHVDELKQFLLSETWSQRCLNDLLNFLQRNQFDGAAVELWMQALSVGREAQGYLTELFNKWGEEFHERNMQLIVPVGAPLSNKMEMTGIFTPDMFKMMPNVDYVQVMTYDYHGTIGVAPYPWVENTIRLLVENVPERAKDLMIGLNHYGYLYNDQQMDPVQRERFLEKSKEKNARLEWDDIVKEHRLITSEGRIYYPSLTSVESRIKLAKAYDVGIAIWELGQGLNYFTQVL
ncbi:unnamed protein product, partial [Mesorhabditis spiculigera]